MTKEAQDEVFTPDWAKPSKRCKYCHKFKATHLPDGKCLFEATFFESMGTNEDEANWLNPQAQDQ